MTPICHLSGTPISTGSRRSSASGPCCLQKHHHLPAGLTGVHDAMRFADVLKAEHAAWLGLELARRNLLRDVLQRHVREWETRLTEHEAAEESEIDAARHLQERMCVQ